MPIGRKKKSPNLGSDPPKRGTRKRGAEVSARQRGHAIGCELEKAHRHTCDTAMAHMAFQDMETESTELLTLLVHSVASMTPSPRIPPVVAHNRAQL